MWADDAGTILQTAGVGTLGTDLFTGRGFMDTPDAQVGLAVYGSASPEMAMTSTVGSVIAQRPRAQVMARAAAGDVAAAELKARNAWSALHNFKGVSGDTTFLWIECLQSPFFMGVDEQNRPLYGFNIQAWL